MSNNYVFCNEFLKNLFLSIRLSTFLKLTTALVTLKREKVRLVSTSSTNSRIPKAGQKTLTTLQLSRVQLRKLLANHWTFRNLLPEAFSISKIWTWILNRNEHFFIAVGSYFYSQKGKVVQSTKLVLFLLGRITHVTDVYTLIDL